MIPSRPSSPELWRWASLLANLLDEGLGASSMRALVIHDLREQPRLRIRCQDRAGAHLERELRTLWSHRALWPLGNRGRWAMVRTAGLDRLSAGTREEGYMLVISLIMSFGAILLMTAIVLGTPPTIPR